MISNHLFPVGSHDLQSKCNSPNSEHVKSVEPAQNNFQLRTGAEKIPLRDKLANYADKQREKWSSIAASLAPSTTVATSKFLTKIIESISNAFPFK